VAVENVQHETSSDGSWGGGGTMVAPGPFHPRTGPSTATMDGGTDFPRDIVRIGHCRDQTKVPEQSELIHNQRLFTGRSGYPWTTTPTRGGGETMGPVPFNRTRVKQEDRYGKRRK
jgi:hypothetical protein